MSGAGVLEAILAAINRSAPTADCEDSNWAHCDTIVPAEFVVLHLMSLFFLSVDWFLNKMKPIQRCTGTP